MQSENLHSGRNAVAERLRIKRQGLRAKPAHLPLVPILPTGQLAELMILLPPDLVSHGEPLLLLRRGEVMAGKLSDCLALHLGEPSFKAVDDLPEADGVGPEPGILALEVTNALGRRIGLRAGDGGEECEQGRGEGH
jgi:hypothetical protein